MKAFPIKVSPAATSLLLALLPPLISWLQSGSLDISPAYVSLAVLLLSSLIGWLQLSDEPAPATPPVSDPQFLPAQPDSAAYGFASRSVSAPAPTPPASKLKRFFLG